MAGRAFKAELESGIATLGLNLSGSQVVALLDYIDLLARWNRTYKLTAVAEPSEVA